MNATQRNPLLSALLALLCVSLLGGLAGCAGTPPRDWQINAREALEQTLENYLIGNERLAQAEFVRAREAIASTGRIDLLARLALARCAAQVASLAAAENAGCPEFEAVQADARAEEKSYADFLAGRWQGLSVETLPKQYRPLLGNTANPVEIKQLMGITDPLARLVAAGVLLQRGQLLPEGIVLAVDTASSQGWRRPLLAWLAVQAQRADAVGNSALAAQVRRRIALAGGNAGDAK
jgi:hypothetical protein